MKKYLLSVFIAIVLIFTLIGCSKDVTDKPTVSTKPQQEKSEPIVNEKNQIATDSTNKIELDETVEKYYNYFRNNQQIVALLDQNGLTDDKLAAFAIMSFDDYDYEKGNTKEEYDVVTEKYFGRKIKNFNNGMSEIIPGTNMVRATGWSFDSGVYMILKSYKEEPSGIKNVEFYTFNISDSVFFDLPQKSDAEIKNDLLSGNYSVYGNPFIVEMKFEEKTDENGNFYLKYLDVKAVDDIVDKIIPYSPKF
ncbi:MAG: hypothetical protein PHV56_04670 [Clostridia bacterium]|nr:hypothetical protein [Clostridia bacterium]